MNELQATNTKVTEPEQMSDTAVARSIKEVEGKIILAKKFPRNLLKVHDEIMVSCKRRRLAEAAEYSFPRGKTLVKGPSIRLAETIAQSFGNLDFGVRELSSDPKKGESVVESYCWDLEKNTCQRKTFTVRHWRDTKGGGYKLTDARDVYEKVANDGARRLRACILAIIPTDIVEDAQEQCRLTLRGNNDMPLIDRLKKLLEAFKKLSVDKGMIEKRLNHDVEQIDESEMDELRTIYNSLKDGISKRENWFEFQAKRETSDKSKDINNKIKGETSNESEVS